MDAPLEEWRVTMDVNLWGTLQMTKAAVPAMIERGGGSIVMINSMSTHRIEPTYGAYAASKGALETATKTLALELGPHAIRVNGVFPGYIWGDSVEWYFGYLGKKRGISGRGRVRGGGRRDRAQVPAALERDRRVGAVLRVGPVQAGHGPEPRRELRPLDGAVIKLTVLVKRNPALSVEEFHDEWRAHGRMIAAEPVFARYIKRYEQHHRVPADYRNGDTHDGMAVQWYESYA